MINIFKRISSIGFHGTNKMPRSIFIAIAAVIIFLYFEMMTNILFLKLLRGYLIKVWVIPLVLFALVCVRRIFSSEVKMEKSDWLLVLYSISGFIAMCMGEETMYFTFKFYLIMIAPVWFYFVILELFRDNEDIELMLKVLFFASVGYAALSFLFNISYQHSPYMNELNVVTSAGNVVAVTEAHFDYQGELFSRGMLSVENSKYCGMLAPAVLLGLIYFLRAESKIKYLYFVCSLFMLWEIMKTMSRAGIMTIVVGAAVAVYCVFMNERFRRKKIMLFSALFLLLAGFYTVKYQSVTVLRLLQPLNVFEIQSINEFLFRHNILEFSTDSYADPHWDTVAMSLDTFKQSPYFGMGYSYAQFFLREHCRYLFILASAGLMTFVPYVLFLLTAVWKSGRNMKRYRRINQPVFNYGYIFFACNVMFVAKLFNEGMETFYYWIVIALSMAWIRNCERIEATESADHVKT